MKKGTTSLEEIQAEESDLTAHYRKQIEVLNTQLKRCHQQIGERTEFCQQVAAAVVAAKPYPPFKYSRANPKGSPVAAVMQFSDWHIGEDINGEEIEGWNVYNFEIAKRRLFTIVQDFLKWVEIQRQLYVIHECHILVQGDLISGDIHDELRVTAEFPVPVQTAKAGLLLAEAVRVMSAHFDKVIVHMVAADNHSRLMPKPQCKQKVSNSMGYLINVVAKEKLEECKNVEINESQGMKLLVDILGKKFLVEHGDTIKAHMGIPYYGFSRSTGKEATRRMNTEQGFHYRAVAHYHVAGVIEGNTLMNGCLCGTSEYDHAAGRFSPPCQVGFLVHPKHGIFNWTPFSVI